MKVVLQSVDLEDSYQDEETARRVVYTLSFECTVDMYGYITNSVNQVAEFIKDVEVIDETQTPNIDGVVDPDTGAITIDQAIPIPGIINKVILDQLDYCLYSEDSEQIGYWPVLDRTIYSARPDTATQPSEVTGVETTSVEPVLESDQRPPPTDND